MPLRAPETHHTGQHCAPKTPAGSLGAPAWRPVQVSWSRTLSHTLFRIVLLILVLLASGSGRGPTPAIGGSWPGDSEVALRIPGDSWQRSCDWAPVTELVEDRVHALGLEGASLLLIKDGRIVYEHAFGSYTLQEQVPIASASKWLTAATIMALVDDCRLALDDPISRYLPAFTDLVGQATVRQVLSHTSGLGPDPPCLGVDSYDLEQCVEQMRMQGLVADPGTVFYYATGPFEVLCRIAEMATGQQWPAIFAQEIKDPLHMGSTSYGETPNPNIGGGAVSTLHDYGGFLGMLLDYGYVGSQRVLSPASVREMETNQTDDLPIVLSIHQDGRRYGLGVWLDRVDEKGRTLQVSCQGDTGFSPWIDRERNLAGVFLTDAGLGNVYKMVDDVQERVRQTVDACGAR